MDQAPEIILDNFSIDDTGLASATILVEMHGKTLDLAKGSLLQRHNGDRWLCTLFPLIEHHLVSGSFMETFTWQMVKRGSCAFACKMTNANGLASEWCHPDDIEWDGAIGEACDNVVCGDYCYGGDLWTAHCVDGECTTAEKIEEGAEQCRLPPPSPDEISIPSLSTEITQVRQVGEYITAKVGVHNVGIPAVFTIKISCPEIGSVLFANESFAAGESKTFGFIDREGWVMPNVNRLYIKFDVVGYITESRGIQLNVPSDKCKDVVCPSYCVGVDEWAQECSNQTGFCYRSTLIKRNSPNCGYTPPPIPECAAGDVKPGYVCVDGFWEETEPPEPPGPPTGATIEFQEMIPGITPPRVPLLVAGFESIPLLPGWIVRDADGNIVNEGMRLLTLKDIIGGD